MNGHGMIQCRNLQKYRVSSHVKPRGVNCACTNYTSALLGQNSRSLTLTVVTEGMTRVDQVAGTSVELMMRDKVKSAKKLSIQRSWGHQCSKEANVETELAGRD